MQALTASAADVTENAQPAAPCDADGQPSDATSAAATPRHMIPVSDLAVHHGNVRDDLNLTEEFVASIAAEGVRIPLLITTGADGRWLVIEGHRRLAAAVKAGLAQVPCDLDTSRAGDEAGQYLDMLLANGSGYRANYTVLEEVAALFAAHEAGATRTRIRKATGRTAAQVKTALTAGQLSSQTSARAAELDRDVALDDLALLAEFDGDEAATDRLLACLQHGYPLEHAAERIRQDKAEAAEHQRLRAELEAAGIPVTDGLPPGAAWLTQLSHDGQDLTAEAHATCPGRGATFPAWNLRHPSHYCTSPAGHGHASRWTLPGASGDGDGTATAGQLPDPGPDPAPDPAPDPGRRLVITGNKAWQAASDVRHRWLAASLFPRRAVPREVQAFTARQLIAMTDPLRSGLATAGCKPLFATLTGHDAAEWEQACDPATTGRLAVLMLAPIVTAYEHAMTDAEGRNTWRTDRYSPCPRAAAAGYLTFLASIGYQLSAIEQAVADGTPYTGDSPSASSILPGDQPDDGNPPGQDPGDQDGPAVPDSVPAQDADASGQAAA